MGAPLCSHLNSVPGASLRSHLSSASAAPLGAPPGATVNPPAYSRYHTMFPEELESFEAYLSQVMETEEPTTGAPSGEKLGATQLPDLGRLIDSCYCMRDLWAYGDIEESEIRLKSFAMDGNSHGTLGDLEHMFSTWPPTNVPVFETFRQWALDSIYDANGGSFV